MKPFWGAHRHVIATGRRRGWPLLTEGSHPLPGRHVTDHQMRLYMTFRQTDGPAVAAAKAAISPATAYRFEQDHRLPSSIENHYWDKLLGAVRVRTPDAAFDLMLNRWLLYQTIASRIMARAGFY